MKAFNIVLLIVSLLIVTFLSYLGLTNFELGKENIEKSITFATAKEVDTDFYKIKNEDYKSMSITHSVKNNTFKINIAFYKGNVQWSAAKTICVKYELVKGEDDYIVYKQVGTDGNEINSDYSLYVIAQKDPSSYQFKDAYYADTLEEVNETIGRIFLIESDS